MVVAPLLLYTDDASGNKSKKWNKFDCWCFLLPGMPRHENAQLHNIHFITCSNQVAVPDMASPVVADLKMLEKGMVTYDACLKKDVLLLAPTMAIRSDNPRHSELLNHAGASANTAECACKITSGYTI